VWGDYFEERMAYVRGLTYGETLTDEEAIYQVCKAYIVDGRFALYENGLYVWFNAYDIGSYASGPGGVTVPYSEIEDILK
jgi:hypothetical protein